MKSPIPAAPEDQTKTPRIDAFLWWQANPMHLRSWQVLRNKRAAVLHIPGIPFRIEEFFYISVPKRKSDEVPGMIMEFIVVSLKELVNVQRTPWGTKDNPAPQVEVLSVTIEDVLLRQQCPTLTHGSPNVSSIQIATKTITNSAISVRKLHILRPSCGSESPTAPRSVAKLIGRYEIYLRVGDNY
jgi:hypothetical protein